MELPLKESSCSSALLFDPSWTPKRAQLRFLVGEIPLFALELPLLVQETHFTRQLVESGTGDACAGELPASVRGFLIRSRPVTERLPRVSISCGFIRYVPAQYERYFIDLRGTFAEYLGKFSSKSRWTLQRKVRRLATLSDGRVDWRVYRTPDEMREFYPLARKVSEVSYQERLLHAGLPEDEEFRAEIFEHAKLGRTRGYLLFHQGKPIAYLLCVVEGSDILLYRYLGYNPHYQRWSPGMVLQYLVLEKLFAEREMRMFDFTEGEGPQKKFLSTGSVRCADIYRLPCRPVNLLIVVLHSILDVVSDCVVKTLDMFGLKSHVKNFVRSRSVRSLASRELATTCSYKQT
jgi:hypothetical protein